MNQPIHGEQINRVLLKPRFRLELDQNQEAVLDKFKDNLAGEDCKFCSKISGNHIFLDVPEQEEHFWSPQLQVEVIKDENDKTIYQRYFGS